MISWDFFNYYFIQKNLNLIFFFFCQAVSITGTEICPKIFQEKILEKSLCIGSVVRRAGYFAFKVLCCILGHLLCQVPNKEQFSDTGRKFQTSGNRTEKIPTSLLVHGWQHQLAVGMWDCDSALLLVLVKLPSDRCLSCKATTVPGNLAGDCLLLFIKLVLFC